MKSFFRPNFSTHQSSQAGRAGPSERTASPEPGRAGSTDKSDKPKSRFFDTPLNPSRLASEFNKLFGKNDEAKKELKQSAQKILDQVEKHLRGEMSFDEKTKKKLNSSLRKTMTADEMGMLANTLNAAKKNKFTDKNGNMLLDPKDSMIKSLSATTEKFASGHISKDEFMGELKNATQKLNDVMKERMEARAVSAALAALGDLDRKGPKFNKECRTYESIMQLKSPAERAAKFREFFTHLEKINVELKNQQRANKSQHQSPPRSGPPPQRPQSGPPPRQPQSAQRPAPQAMPKPASMSVAYTGRKLSFGAGVIRPDEARKHAEELKQHLSPGQLKELHSDLMALANNAPDDTKSAFNEKYKNVFRNKYDDNPAAFSVLGRIGLKGCGGSEKESSLFVLPKDTRRS